MLITPTVVSTDKDTKGNISMLKRWIVVMVALLLVPWMKAGFAAPALAPTQVDQGLLWKLEKPGVKPSYLLGTMHSEDAAIVELPEAGMAALQSADRVSLEIVMDTQNMASLSGAMEIVAGPELPELLGQELYRQLVSSMSNQGVPEHVLRRLKPWAVAMTLMMPKSNTGLALDRVLYLEALAKGKPVTGLESVAEQVEVFEGLESADQILLVREALKAYPKLEQTYADLRAAYLKGDLQALAALNDAAMKEGDSDFAQRFTARLIDDRNVRMAERMHEGLTQGNTFFAVGALHLPGQQGILQLLRKQGYKTTAVY